LLPVCLSVIVAGLQPVARLLRHPVIVDVNYSDGDGECEKCRKPPDAVPVTPLNTIELYYTCMQPEATIARGRSTTYQLST